MCLLCWHDNEGGHLSDGSCFVYSAEDCPDLEGMDEVTFSCLLAAYTHGSCNGKHPDEIYADWEHGADPPEMLPCISCRSTEHWCALPSLHCYCLESQLSLLMLCDCHFEPLKGCTLCFIEGRETEEPRLIQERAQHGPLKAPPEEHCASMQLRGLPQQEEGRRGRLLLHHISPHGRTGQLSTATLGRHSGSQRAECCSQEGWPCDGNSTTGRLQWTLPCSSRQDRLQDAR